MSKDKTNNHKIIIEEAKKEFLEYGFAKASLRRIAASAGMSASGMYKHFPSKEAMFGELIKPAYDDFLDIFRNGTEYDYEEESVENLRRMLEGSEVTKIINYVYDNYDAFKLVICKSQGTKYENFIEELSLIDEMGTLKFIDALRKKGEPIKDINKEEFHMLAITYATAMFKPVEFDYPKEKAIHYAKTMDEFFAPAWKSFFYLEVDKSKSK
ncbi:MAG: TetR/AcrR family transcriptional regulator; helix-turn-helix transcriptional regulator [Lachnospiraceae bacterium]|nr:TetR/AcrR family transcriptional regulator; helix-turn-helix transcriptional regulator [Lachnospiraceae bacterium]